MKSLFLLVAVIFSLSACGKSEERESSSTGGSLGVVNQAAAYKKLEDEERRASYYVDDALFKKYLKMAEEGHPDAQYKIGILYHKRIRNDILYSMHEDNKKMGYCDEICEGKKEAQKWILKSAENGNKLAQYNMGMAYEQGDGVEKNKFESFRWYKAAADNAMPSASSKVADAYRNGWVGNKDCEKARDYLEKGLKDSSRDNASRDEKLLNSFLRLDLERLYDDEGCTPKLKHEILGWYLSGAELDIKSAMNELGLIYEYGKMVPQDFSIAAHYYELAANKGYKISQYNIALLYAKGLGVIKNPKTAYFWALLASSDGDRDAVVLREKLERMITPEERIASQAEAKKWKDG